MAISTVPTLSTDGWVNDPKAMLDACFSDFLVAMASQYPQSTVESSMSLLMAKYQDKPDVLATNVKNVLTEYMSKYFVNVEVNVRAIDNPDRGDYVDLKIEMDVTHENGSIHSLLDVLKVGQQRVVSIAQMNNGTLPYSEV